MTINLSELYLGNQCCDCVNVRSIQFNHNTLVILCKHKPEVNCRYYNQCQNYVNKELKNAFTELIRKTSKQKIVVKRDREILSLLITFIVISYVLFAIIIIDFIKW